MAIISCPLPKSPILHPKDTRQRDADQSHFCNTQTHSDLILLITCKSNGEAFMHELTICFERNSFILMQSHLFKELKALKNL